MAGGELHEGAAADVGGADEEDLERGLEARFARTSTSGGQARFARTSTTGVSGLDARSSLALVAARPPVWCVEREVEVAGVPESHDDVVEGVGDGAAGGVHADVGVLGDLVGAGDAGELGDLPGTGLGVEALAVAALALLQRGRDVDEEERPSGLLDHRADLLPRLVEGSDRADDRQAAVTADLGGDPADAADVGLPVGLGEGEPGGEVPTDHVAVEAGDGAAALLEDLVHQRPSQRGLAAAGEPGEEEHQPLLVGRRTVRGHHVGHHVGVVAVGVVGQRSHEVAGCVCRQHLDTQRVVGVGVVMGGQRDGDDRGIRQRLGHQAGRADQRHRGEVRGPGADQCDQHDRPETAHLAHLRLGEGVGDGDPGATGVLLARLGRGEVEVAEGAVLRVGEGLDRAARHRDARQRQALGVDELDAAGSLGGVADVLGERERDEGLEARFARTSTTGGGLARTSTSGGGPGQHRERGERGEGSGREELEVVELARGRAELREGTHLSILTEVVEFQGMGGAGLRSRP